MHQRVKEMLTEYRELKRKLGLLAFRIEKFPKLNADRTIEELTYASSEGERVKSSGVADKTSKIALSYKQITDEHNASILEELRQRYESQKYELELLEYCISLLEKELSELITDMVINEMDMAQLSEKYKMSRTSVRRQRTKAVSEIAEMFKEIAGENDVQKTG